MAEKKKEKKKGFKMPHLLFIMLGLIFIMTALTYVVPAGQFGTTAEGKIDATVFNYLPEQTPVSFLRVPMLFLDGLTGSALIIFLVMVSGASIGLFLDTGCVDELINWSLFKLKDKGVSVLVPAMYILMVYLGAFGGSDAMIAVVPIGVLFAKKLKLDPLVAMGITTYATLIGFGTGPTKQMITQTMMGVPIYSGFGVRMIIMNIILVVGLVYLMMYVRRIQKDPTKSAMGNTDWLQDTAADNVEVQEAIMTPKTALLLFLFIFQYLIVVWYTMQGYDNPYHFQVAVFIILPIVAGLIKGMSGDEIGNSFAKGLASMAFVGFVIGLARVVSLVMGEGNIIHTIVYVITRPLLSVGQGLASVLMTWVIAIINPIIPSASSKAAILVPIIQPVAEAIGLTPQLAVQAFQFGDGYTNLISPALGWTVGSTAMAKVDFDKWLKWALPITIIFLLVSSVMMYILTGMGWTGV